MILTFSVFTQLLAGQKAKRFWKVLPKTILGQEDHFIWRHNATSNLIKVTHWLYDSLGNKISSSFSSDINTQHDDLRSYMTRDNSYLIIPGFLVTVGLDRRGMFFNPFCLLKGVFYLCLMFVQGEFKRMLNSIKTFRKSFFFCFFSVSWWSRR